MKTKALKLVVDDGYPQFFRKGKTSWAKAHERLIGRNAYPGIVLTIEDVEVLDDHAEEVVSIQPSDGGYYMMLPLPRGKKAARFQTAWRKYLRRQKRNASNS